MVSHLDQHGGHWPFNFLSPLQWTSLDPKTISHSVGGNSIVQDPRIETQWVWGIQPAASVSLGKASSSFTAKFYESITSTELCQRFKYYKHLASYDLLKQAGVKWQCSKLIVMNHNTLAKSCLMKPRQLTVSFRTMMECFSPLRPTHTSTCTSLCCWLLWWWKSFAHLSNPSTRKTNCLTVLKCASYVFIAQGKAKHETH